MKKLLLIMCVAFIGYSASAQEGNLRAGAYLGFPIGDASKVSSFALGLDGVYLFEVSEKFEAGFGTGLSFYTGKNGAQSATFLPFYGAARFNIDKKFMVGVDLGYAVALSSGLKGGFQYRPMFGYNIDEKFQVTVSLAGIARGDNNGGSANALLFGGTYKFDM